MHVQAQEQRVESARYALLRRLAFAMRHHMVVHLQPIGMITEVMERRIQSGASDPTQIHDAMAKVNTHARAAVQSSLDVVSWLAPEDGELASAETAVQECVDLLRSHLTFRGFTLVQPRPGFARKEVSRAAVRSVLPAVLLALTDTAASPADVAISARDKDQQLLLTVEVRRKQGAPGFSGEPHYRLLQWADVEAIAGAEGVTLTRDGAAVTMSFGV